jgi:dihydroxyacetone kinase
MNEPTRRSPEQLQTMNIDSVAIRKLLTTAAERIFSHADELTALDRVIGDGDHGLNMKRGFEAILADVDNISAQPLPQALQAAGTTLVMKFRGASGPLFRSDRRWPRLNTHQNRGGMRPTRCILVRQSTS